MTCEITHTDDQQVEVAFYPHWNPAAASVERFSRPVDALKQHARLVMELRDAGWRVIDRNPFLEPIAA